MIEIDVASLIIGIGVASLLWFFISLVSQNKIIKEMRDQRDKEYEKYIAPKYRIGG